MASSRTDSESLYLDCSRKNPMPWGVVPVILGQESPSLKTLLYHWHHFMLYLMVVFSLDSERYWGLKGDMANLACHRWSYWDDTIPQLQCSWGSPRSYYRSYPQTLSHFLMLAILLVFPYWTNLCLCRRTPSQSSCWGERMDSLRRSARPLAILTLLTLLGQWVAFSSFIQLPSSPRPWRTGDPWLREHHPFLRGQGAVMEACEWDVGVSLRTLHWSSLCEEGRQTECCLPWCPYQDSRKEGCQLRAHTWQFQVPTSPTAYRGLVHLWPLVTCTAVCRRLRMSFKLVYDSLFPQFIHLLC